MQQFEWFIINYVYLINCISINVSFFGVRYRLKIYGQIIQFESNGLDYG